MPIPWNDKCHRLISLKYNGILWNWSLTSLYKRSWIFLLLDLDCLLQHCFRVCNPVMLITSSIWGPPIKSSSMPCGQWCFLNMALVECSYCIYQPSDVFPKYALCRLTLKSTNRNMSPCMLMSQRHLIESSWLENYRTLLLLEVHSPRSIHNLR